MRCFRYTSGICCWILLLDTGRSIIVCRRLGRWLKKIYDICIENIKIAYLCIMSNAEIITSFSKNLFWDVDPGTINLESNSRYIIQRVLEYGRYNDWKLILSHYGIKVISDTATTLRSLDPKAVSFISAITNIPKEQFRCYTLGQSSQRHWSF